MKKTSLSPQLFTFAFFSSHLLSFDLPGCWIMQNLIVAAVLAIISNVAAPSLYLFPTSNVLMFFSFSRSYPCRVGVFFIALVEVSSMLPVSKYLLVFWLSSFLYCFVYRSFRVAPEFVKTVFRILSNIRKYWDFKFLFL